MKSLSVYVAQICSALESRPTDNEGVPQDLTITLGANDMSYRLIIAHALKNSFCCAGSEISDALFAKQQSILLDCEMMSKELYERDKVKAEKTSMPPKTVKKIGRPPKVKRDIQKAPKKGKIKKAAIEKAIKKMEHKPVDGGL